MVAKMVLILQPVLLALRATRAFRLMSFGDDAWYRNAREYKEAVLS